MVGNGTECGKDGREQGGDTHWFLLTPPDTKSWKKHWTWPVTCARVHYDVPCLFAASHVPSVVQYLVWSLINLQ